MDTKELSDWSSTCRMVTFLPLRILLSSVQLASVRDENGRTMRMPPTTRERKEGPERV
jgi:hypothetical protein